MLEISGETIRFWELEDECEREWDKLSGGEQMYVNFTSEGAIRTSSFDRFYSAWMQENWGDDWRLVEKKAWLENQS